MVDSLIACSEVYGCWVVRIGLKVEIELAGSGKMKKRNEDEVFIRGSLAG